MRPFEWVEAASVDQAVALSKGNGAAIKAGGIDLLDLMKEGVVAPKRLVNLRNAGGLDTIVVEAPEGSPATLQIGALVTLARLAADPGVRAHFPALADAAGQAATPQIRNVATVGGNLLQRPRCWYLRNEAYPCRKKGGHSCYAQDGENRFHAIFGNEMCAIVHPSSLATALTAYGAKVRIATDRGMREAGIESFLAPPEKDIERENTLASGEVITKATLAGSQGMRSAYVKVGEKESFDWPLADCAVVLDLSGGKVARASIVLGAAAPVPWRAKAAEAVVVGKTPDEDVARLAGKAALDGARPLAQNGYKLPIFEAIVRRAILAAARK